MKTPKLSHLQCRVIESIGGRKIPGRDLRARLADAGEKKSGPAFYQMMARMEEGGLVEGEYTQKIVEGQIIKERVYKVTGHGHTAYHEALEFYRSLAAFAPPSYV